MGIEVGDMAEMNRVSRFFVNRFNSRRNARVCAWIVENVPPRSEAAWLEIGCGNGDLASRLLDDLRPAHYVATDLDARQLDVARRHLADRYPSGLPSALELREADMLHLPFADASFDEVIAVVSIHHATPNHHESAEVPTALAEIDRVLRPGGTLAYEEILHKDLIRSWLLGRGYTLSGIVRGIKRESVVARKPGGR